MTREMARRWHDRTARCQLVRASYRNYLCELVRRCGAGEGNRTLMTSLEGWGSAIELRPRGCAAAFGSLQYIPG
jgi:hypothetical protein